MIVSKPVFPNTPTAHSTVSSIWYCPLKHIAPPQTHTIGREAEHQMSKAPFNISPLDDHFLNIPGR